MGVKRQHTFEVIGPDRYLDQYVATYDYVVGLGRDGVPGRVLDYCDEHFPDDDWDWHFKIIGVVESQSSLMNGNVETNAHLSFRSERDAFDFWWWYEQQDF
jgi:hypothetical protein